MEYRPEIDGLRAIAVTAVLLYHANFQFASHDVFPGGYLGVDIFFVISGYLIGHILLSKISTNSFSYRHFYERRIRRIFPALFLTFIISFIVADNFLLPQAIKEYGGSLLTSSIFGSNYYFAFLEGYEAESSKLQLLIHTWSLSVEEQFYILCPLFIGLIYKFWKKNIHSVLLTAFLLSLIYAGFLNNTSEDLAFMSIFTRAWELLAGVFLAQLQLSKSLYKFKEKFSLFTPSLNFLAVFTLVMSFILFNHDTSHPGILTVIPILATFGLLMLSGGEDLISQMLKSKAFTFTGLISYSLYLFHQPILVLGRYLYEEEFTEAQKIIALIVSYLAAAISYKLVEQPFRNSNFIPAKYIWALAVIGTIGFFTLGSILYSTSLTKEMTAEKSIVKTVEEASIVYGNTLKQGDQNCSIFETGQIPCLFKYNNKDKAYTSTFITIGDSHLKTLHLPLHDYLTQSQKHQFMPLSGTSCIFSTTLYREEVDCNPAYNHLRLSYILKQKNPIVIYGGRLPLYLNLNRFDNQEGGVEYGNPVEPFYLDASFRQKANYQDIKNDIRSTIQNLLDNNIKVILIYPVPNMGWNIPKKLRNIIRKKNLEKLDTLSVDYGVFQKLVQPTYQIYNSIPNNKNLLRVYPEDVFCNIYLKNRCVANTEKEVFYRDDDHLSYTGGRKLLNHVLSVSSKKWGNIF